MLARWDEEKLRVLEAGEVKNEATMIVNTRCDIGDKCIGQIEID